MFNLRNSILALAFALLVPFGAIAEETMVEEEIVVIGSRGKPRTVVDSIAPVDSFTREEFQAQGNVDFRDMLRTAVPSFNVDRFPLHDERSFSRPSTLRGLTADQTLILLDGKRRHRGAIINRGTSPTVGSTQPVDLNTIPSIALGRVEVLRDGAAAQYGSDAIAGVINLVLRKDTGITSFSGQTGLYDKSNDGDRNTFSFYTGHLLADDKAFFSFAYEGSDEDPTNRGHQDSRALGLINGGADAFNTNCVGVVNFGNAACSTGRYGLYEVDTGAFRQPVVTSWGAGDSQSSKLLLNFTYDFGENLEFYSTVTDTITDGLGSFYWRNPTNRDGVFDTFDTARIPNPDTLDYTTKVAIPDAVAPDPLFNDVTATLTLTQAQKDWLTQLNAPAAAVDFRGMYPGGYVPQYVGEGKDTSARLGLRGITTSGWNYDLSFGYGYSGYDFSLSDSLNPSYGATTPYSFNLGTLENIFHSLNIDLQREFTLSEGNSASLAIGLENTKEEYAAIAGDQASWDYIRDGRGLAGTSPTDPLYSVRALDIQACYDAWDSTSGTFAGEDCRTARIIDSPAVGSHGAQGTSPGQAGDWERESVAFYIDAEFEFASDGTLGLAYRYEDYDGFASTGDAKISVRVGMAENSNFRSTISTGFRVPTVGQVFSSNIATRIRDGEFFADADFSPLHPVSQALGAKPLTPENSINLSLGFTGSFENGGYWSTDYYNIRLSDRIRVSEPYTVATLTDAQRVALVQIVGEPFLNSLDTIRFFANEFNTETRGIDVVVSLPVGVGWDWTLAHNWNKTNVTRRNAGSLSTGAVKDLENVLPNHRTISTLTRSGDIVNFNLRGRYYGRWEDYNGAGSAVAYQGKSAILFDTSLSFNVINSRGNLTVGLDNLFNHFPDSYGVSASGLPYNNETPYGYQGRFAYVRFGFNLGH